MTPADSFSMDMSRHIGATRYRSAGEAAQRLIGCALEYIDSLCQQTSERGLKGCTVFRLNPVTDAILGPSDGRAQVRCRTLER